MKVRYNLRCASKASTNSRDIFDDGLEGNEDADDEYQTLLARHHRRMLEEQKERKNYERYVRHQRTLRQMQCRKSHTAHLNDITRQRLLRGLLRERRYVLHEQICADVAERTFAFESSDKVDEQQLIDWKIFEEELLQNSKSKSIHQLDQLINQLKKMSRTILSTRSKPRLSVRERQKQRLVKTDKNDRTSLLASTLLNLSLPLSVASLSPHIPLVRYVDPQQTPTTTNAQHLTSIQNVLSSNSPCSSFENRTKSTSSVTSEKENCHSSRTIQGNILLRTGSPMVSLKQTITRSYPNTRRQGKPV